MMRIHILGMSNFQTDHHVSDVCYVVKKKNVSSIDHNIASSATDDTFHTVRGTNFDS